MRHATTFVNNHFTVKPKLRQHIIHFVGKTLRSTAAQYLFLASQSPPIFDSSIVGAVNTWKSETNAFLWPFVRVWRNLRFFQEDWNIRRDYISIRLHGWSSIMAWMRSSTIIVSDGSAELMSCYSCLEFASEENPLSSIMELMWCSRLASCRVGVD